MSDPNASDDTALPARDAWGVREGTRVWLGGHDLPARRVIEAHLAGAARPSTGPLDLGLIAPSSLDEALYFANKLMPRLRPDGGLWVVTSAQDLAADLERALLDLGFLRCSDVVLNGGFTAFGFRRV